MEAQPLVLDHLFSDETTWMRDHPLFRDHLDESRAPLFRPLFLMVDHSDERPPLFLDHLLKNLSLRLLLLGFKGDLERGVPLCDLY